MDGDKTILVIDDEEVITTEMTGFQLTREMFSRRPNLPVILGPAQK